MAQSKKSSFGWGTLFVGLFVGVIVGLALALAAAWKLGGNAVVEVFSKDKTTASQRADGSSTTKPGEKPNFDFYKVLPEGSEGTAKNDKTIASPANAPTSAPTAKPATAVASIPETPSARPGTTTLPPTTPATPPGVNKPKDIYWLQVGSFARQEEADARKAELAMYGWEASVQKGEAPGRGAFYRVRVGPYDSAEKTGRAKAELTQRKFDVAIVRQ
ncbi:MAG: SPOR domain-containing protein [Betaproteobacteria bacterium]|nr:SPOR domain-containing protein [Betaproteobacteria bacterium]